MLQQKGSPNASELFPAETLNSQPRSQKLHSKPKTNRMAEGQEKHPRTPGDSGRIIAHAKFSLNEHCWALLVWQGFNQFPDVIKLSVCSSQELLRVPGPSKNHGFWPRRVPGSSRNRPQKQLRNSIRFFFDFWFEHGLLLYASLLVAKIMFEARPTRFSYSQALILWFIKCFFAFK